MSVKSQSRTIGRMLRSMTGLDLPIAMKLGRMIIQDKSYLDIMDKFPSVITSQRYCPGCCDGLEFTITGKKGKVMFRDGITKSMVQEKFKYKEFQKTLMTSS